MKVQFISISMIPKWLVCDLWFASNHCSKLLSFENFSKYFPSPKFLITWS